MLSGLALLLAAQGQATPAARDAALARSDAAVASWRECVLLHARRYAPVAEAADLVARAAMSACSGQDAEAEQRMYGTGSTIATIERVMERGRTAMHNRAIREVIEARLAVRR